MAHEPGFELSWWFKNKTNLRKRLVRTPLESVASAGIFTMPETLPEGSILNYVICTVAELVGSDKNVSYGASTFQLFVPSEGGFSQDFRLDHLPDSAHHGIYRCFWYLGAKLGEMSNDLPYQSARDCIFIGSAGDNIKEFSDQKVITLAGYYGESDRKFRLHPGDILIMDVSNPFAVDLPIGGRVKEARVLSWLVFPRDGDTAFPTVIKESEIVMGIEEIISSNTEARDYYNTEFDTFEVNPGPMGDPEEHMQRLRVTPSKYDPKDIMEEVESNPLIFYVDTEYFSK